MRFPVVDEFLAEVRDKVFREEVRLLSFAGRDLFIHPPDLQAQRVMGTLTVDDMLQVWRIVNLMAGSFAEYLKPLLVADSALCRRSLVPAFSDEMLQNMLTRVLGPEKASEYMKHLAVGQAKNRDLIYQPLIRAGSHWHVPMNMVANSNFVRNGFALSQQRLYDSRDPLGGSFS